jgi:hypothetical protein
MIEEKNKGQLQEQQAELSQDLEEDQETLRRPIDRWISSFKQGMENKKAQREKSRQKATQDRMKPVFLGLLAVVVTAVILLGMFSTPMSKRKGLQTADRKTPNLGRPQVNDSVLPQPENLDHSVTPLLGADVHSQPDPNRGQISEGDLQKYGAKSPPRAAITQPPRSPTPNSPTANSSHALGQIEFSDTTDGRRESLAEVESRIAKLQSQPTAGPTQPTPQQITEALSKPSLVFVHNPNSEQSARAPRTESRELDGQESFAALELPTGMRLMVRLQSAITTAVVTPVVAMVEYNYEKNGEIVVPAGSRVFGKLEQANRSGHVTVKFDTIEIPSGETWRIDGVAQALDFGPLKGRVEGQKNVSRFMTRTLAGVGVVASQMVGLHGGLSGPLDNSLLIRERLANNIAQAGDQQLQQTALSTSIVVTVPGNIRFYLVLQKPVGGMTNSRTGQQAGNLLPMPQDSLSKSQTLTRAELQELRDLKQEFKRLMLMAGGRETSNTEK